ncbi:hypothetical protein NUACC21_22610 [Scytonema sp. NUACC21]
MPLGKILNLLLAALERISAEPTTVKNSQISKAPSTGNVETTEVNAAIITDLLTVTETDDSSYDFLPQTPVATTVSSKPTEEHNNRLSPESPLPKIFEATDTSKISILHDELQNFVSSSNEVQGAILASPDGLTLASVLPAQMDEEHTAAMSTSMLSLGERIGTELARGSVERVVIEGDRGYGVLVGCSHDAVLLILASSTVKQGVLFLEIKRAVAKIALLLE